MYVLILLYYLRVAQLILLFVLLYIKMEIKKT